MFNGKEAENKKSRLILSNSRLELFNSLSGFISQPRGLCGEGEPSPPAAGRLLAPVQPVQHPGNSKGNSQTPQERVPAQPQGAP